MVKPTISIGLWMVFAWMMSTPVTAEEVKKSPAPLVEMSLSPARIDWHSADPAVTVQRWVLALSGPDELFFRREFKTGKTPFLSVFDSEGDRLPDGSYTWELKAVSQGSTDPRRESGSFSIQDGSFVETPRGIGGGAPKPPLVSTTAEDFVAPGGITIQSSQPYIIFDDMPFPEIGMFSSHDWALITNMNDVNQFSIIDWPNGLVPFNIAAGAPDNSLHISSNGNVGIGTPTPAVRLDLKANVTGQAAVRLQNSSATGYSGTEYLDNAGNVDLFFGIDNATSTTRLNSVNNPIVILTNSVERMRVTTDGKFGIGTTSPSDKFHFFENTDASTLLTVENSSTGAFAASALRAKSDSALVGLVTHSSGKTISRFGQTLGGWAELLQATGNGLIIGTQTDKPLILGTNSVNRVQVTASGDVGIGTTAPSSKLHVNGGDIRVSGGSFIDDGVILSAPDYVFEPSYKLMPLSELREFVTQEKHLPNVPKAKEVKEQGLNLSQFQMRLLEKVEELTLYTLTQDERFTAQQEEMLRLKEQNAVLQERLAALEKALSSEEKP